MWLLANKNLPGHQLVSDRQLADFVVVNASLLRALSLFFRSVAGADAGAASESDRHQNDVAMGLFGGHTMCSSCRPQGDCVSPG
jgi:hypothetical protein